MLFYGIIKDLSFKCSNQRSWLDYLENNDGKKVVLEITDDKPKRSLDQNALYWVFLKEIEDYTGEISSDLHEFFKRKLLPPIPKKILGVEFKVPASTKELTKVEFGEYLDKVSALSGVAIPEPLIKEFNILSIYPINNLEPKF